MYAQKEKPKENKSRSISNSNVQTKGKWKHGFGFEDNRSESIAQKKLKPSLPSQPGDVIQRQYGIEAETKIPMLGSDSWKVGYIKTNDYLAEPTLRIDRDNGDGTPEVTHALEIKKNLDNWDARLGILGKADIPEKIIGSLKEDGVEISIDDLKKIMFENDENEKIYTVQKDDGKGTFSNQHINDLQYIIDEFKDAFEYTYAEKTFKELSNILTEKKNLNVDDFKKSSTFLNKMLEKVKPKDYTPDSIKTEYEKAKKFATKLSSIASLYSEVSNQEMQEMQLPNNKNVRGKIQELLLKLGINLDLLEFVLSNPDQGTAETLRDLLVTIRKKIIEFVVRNRQIMEFVFGPYQEGVNESKKAAEADASKAIDLASQYISSSKISTAKSLGIINSELNEGDLKKIIIGFNIEHVKKEYFMILKQLNMSLTPLGNAEASEDITVQSTVGVPIDGLGKYLHDKNETDDFDVKYSAQKIPDAVNLFNKLFNVKKDENLAGLLHIIANTLVFARGYKPSHGLSKNYVPLLSRVPINEVYKALSLEFDKNYVVKIVNLIENDLKLNGNENINGVFEFTVKDYIDKMMKGEDVMVEYLGKMKKTNVEQHHITGNKIIAIENRFPLGIMNSKISNLKEILRTVEGSALKLNPTKKI